MNRCDVTVAASRLYSRMSTQYDTGRYFGRISSLTSRRSAQAQAFSIMDVVDQEVDDADVEEVSKLLSNEEDDLTRNTRGKLPGVRPSSIQVTCHVGSWWLLTASVLLLLASIGLSRISAPSHPSSNENEKRTGPDATVLYGHVHIAKTAGTSINGELAMQYERVCGNKGYSYDAYLVNEREKSQEKNWYRTKDSYTKLNSGYSRGRVHPDIMKEIGFQDCDWVSFEGPDWTNWKLFEDWPFPVELHVPCRDPVDHLMSYCNQKNGGKRPFRCDSSSPKEVYQEIERCLFAKDRYSSELESMDNFHVKCFEFHQHDQYIQWMGERLQRKRIQADYFFRATNKPRDKDSECIWKDEELQKMVRDYLIANYDYYAFCDQCVGTTNDLLAENRTSDAGMIRDKPTSSTASRPQVDQLEIHPTTEKPPEIAGNDRWLVIKPSHGGLTNQMICLQIQANLAVQYNRTLVVPRDGYTGSKHEKNHMAFEILYDVDRARSRLQFCIHGEPGCHPGTPRNRVPYQHKPNPKNKLAVDPYPNDHSIQVHCDWGAVHIATPPQYFPHGDRIFFPFHRDFYDLKDKVLLSIRQQVLETDEDLRLLTLHVRRGDRVTWPMVSCTSTGSLYPYEFFIKGEKSFGCSTSAKPSNLSHDTLTWERLFHHLQCTSSGGIDDEFPICAINFDAIFVSTNDPLWVRDTVMGLDNLSTPVFMMDDFLTSGFIETTTLATSAVGNDGELQEQVDLLIVEELICAESSVHVPSFPSSITEQTLRLRLEAHGSTERDKELYAQYDRYKLGQFAHHAIKS